MRQINTDPWVTVWGAFTYIATIKPLRFLVTFVEFRGSDRQSNSDNQRSVPDAVVTGIATQAVVLGCQEIQEQEDSILLGENLKKSQKSKNSNGIDLKSRILAAAHRNLDGLLDKAMPNELIKNTRTSIDKEIDRITSDVLKEQKKSQNQRPFYEGRRTLAKGNTARIRPIGNQMIYMCSLSAEEIDTLDHNWKPDWNRAFQTYSGNDNPLKWRFGGALYWLQNLIN